MAIPYHLLGQMGRMGPSIRRQQVWQRADAEMAPRQAPSLLEPVVTQTYQANRNKRANLADQLFGSPGASGLLDPQALEAARRQGLLHAGLGILSSRQPMMGALQEGLQAGQQGYGQAVQGALGAQQLQQQRDAQDAMRGFGERVMKAGNNRDAVVGIAKDALATAMQTGNVALGQQAMAVMGRVMDDTGPTVNWQLKERGAINPATNKPEQYAFNPQTQEIKWLGIAPDSKGAEGLTPYQRASLETRDVSQALQFFNNYNRQSEDFNTISQAYGTIRAMATEPSPAGDLGLIFAFMKMLDPGSVVREQEFANAQNAASVPSRIRNMWNRMLAGTRLGAVGHKITREDAIKYDLPEELIGTTTLGEQVEGDQRRDFVKRAWLLARQKQQEAQSLGKHYQTITGFFNVPTPEGFFRDPFSEYDLTRDPTAPNQAGAISDLQKGRGK